MMARNNKPDCTKTPDMVGGQAIVEGVMMRTPNSFAVAVRRKNGDIIVHSQKLKKRRSSSAWKKPFLRGIAALGSTLVLGIKAINFSAALYEQDNVPKKDKSSKLKNKDKRSSPKKSKTSGISTFELVFSITVALALAILLYKAVPLAIAGLFKAWTPVFANTVLFNLVDAVAKILILIAVMWGFTLFKDIRRMYEYHGAEHMAVFTYESGKELNVRNARRFGTLHPRCGTNFLILVFIVSLFFFLTIDPNLSFALKLSMRIALLPFIAAVTYEIIRFGSRRMDSTWARILMAPGLWLQRITTSKPDNAQIEVAVAAVKEALERDKDKSGRSKTYTLKKEIRKTVEERK